MFDLDWPSSYGQENDPPCPPLDETPPSTPEKKRSRARCSALALSADESKAVRVALRKVARTLGGYSHLAKLLEIPSSTLRRLVNPNGANPSGTLAIRLAAVVKMPVEALLAGKMTLTPATIGVAA